MENDSSRLDKRKYIVIYHDDLDGRCSAYIFRKFFNNNYIRFIPYTYGDKLDLMCSENKGDYLYILDVSLKEEELEKCKKIYTNEHEVVKIVWIDHHKSGIELWQKNQHIHGFREDGVAACELTWKWFFPNKEMPTFIKMIADRDVWNFSFYGDNTIWFFEYFDTIHNKPKSAIWDFLYDDFKNKCNTTLNNFIERGKLLRYSKLRNLGLLIEKLSYETTIDKYKCLIMNHSDYGSASDLLHLMMDLGYDVAISYKIKGVGNKLLVDYNIRSRNDVDCSKIAQKRGGGGHKYAAGWYDIYNEDTFFIKGFKNRLL
jgi:oligoribonuclease NrnB/cAMP/cGMP phosphodiesterase (DHH superfamily)